MFSSKNYLVRDEVLDMINKSNQSICQRITLLEEKNVYLEQQNQQLNNNIINLQSLCQRITLLEEKNVYLEQQNQQLNNNIINLQNLLDEVPAIFEAKLQTPKMDMSETHKSFLHQPNNYDFEIKYNELESKLQLLETKFDDTGLEGYVVVGCTTGNNYIPLIVNKKLFNTKNDKTEYCRFITDLVHCCSGRFKLSALKYLKKICTTFELSQLNYHQIFIDDNYEKVNTHILTDKRVIQFGYDGPSFSVDTIKKILSALGPYVKLTYKGSIYYNDKPIRKYVESFY
jgi:hypothetical protein